MNPEFGSLSVADQAAAAKALKRAREDEAEAERAKKINSEKLLHQAIWHNMRFEDRDMFHQLKQEYESRGGSIPLSMLADPQYSFIPGGAMASGVIHDLKKSYLGLARFAKRLHNLKKEANMVELVHLMKNLSDVEVPEKYQNDMKLPRILELIDTLEEMLQVIDVTQVVRQVDADH